MKEPVIIGGVPRSGTTLLRTMLDSHKNIYAGPELGMVMSASEAVKNTWNKIGHRIQTSFNLTEDSILFAYGKAILSVYEDILEQTEKERIADKMPQSIMYFSQLSFMLPQAKFVHIIRDGRDVACSLLNRKDFVDDKGQPWSFTQDSEKGAEYWRYMVGKGKELGHPKHPNRDRYYEIFYEDLVKNPKKEMENLLNFIDEPWDENVLKHFELEHNLEQGFENVLQMPHTKSVGRWKRDLKKRKAFYKKAGDMLEALGYK